MERGPVVVASANGLEAVRRAPARLPVFQGFFGCVIINRKDDNMIRTQISLDAHEYALAKKEAKALGISVAELVRRAVRQMLPPPGGGRWMRFAGFVESGNARSSRSVDEIVYGSKD